MIKLNEETKQKIHEEYNRWVEKSYCGLDMKTRQKNGMFFTPPHLTIRLIEKLKTLDDCIVDPCVGSGNLIAAAVIAGADPKKCFANELDPLIYNLCKERLGSLGVPEDNIYNMDVLDDELWIELQRREEEICLKK